MAFTIPVLMLSTPWMLYVKSKSGQFKLDNFYILSRANDECSNFSYLSEMYLALIYYENRLGYFDNPTERRHIKQEVKETLCQEDSKILMKKYVNHVRKHPERFFKVALFKGQFLWLRSFVISDDPSGSISLDLSPLMKKAYLHDKNYLVLFVNFITAFLGLAGIVGLIRFGLKSLAMALTVLITVGAFVIFFYTTDRYGIPVHNFIILYAVLAIDWICQKVKFRLQLYRTSPC
jgi:hypothetical protein